MVTTTLKMNQKVEECDRGRGGNIEHSVKEPYGNSHTSRATPSQVGKPPSTFIISPREFSPRKILDFCVVQTPKI